MKQINANKNKNHSRVSLSGIFNACCGRVVQKQQNVEDPRLQISGMAPLFYNSVRAFTLIELLVVVLIIGILSAIALPQYQKAVEKARLTTFIPLVRAIHDAEEAYYLANGEYTYDLESLAIQIPVEGCTWKTTDVYGQYYFCKGYSIGTWDGPTNAQYQTSKIAYLHFFTNTSQTGKIWCYAKDETNYHICKSLGPGTPMESNSVWPYKWKLD